MGAWIETGFKVKRNIVNGVAPYVGAWIETSFSFTADKVGYVAPYVGAWIETDCWFVSNDDFLSHPTWVRGLKQIIKLSSKHEISRTLRGCVD